MSIVISENKSFLHRKASVINPEIHLIGIINNQGRMMNLIGNTDLNLPKGRKEMFLMKIALRNSMQKDFDEYLGSVSYCMTQRGNKKYISIPINNGKTILVIANKDADHERIIADIKQMLQYSNQFLGEKLSNEGTGT